MEVLPTVSVPVCDVPFLAMVEPAPCKVSVVPNISNAPLVKVSAPFNVKFWLPTVMPPARLIIRAPMVGAVVNVLLGIVNAAAFVPKVILVVEPTVNVPVVLAIAVVPKKEIALFRISSTPVVNVRVPLIIKP